MQQNKLAGLIAQYNISGELVQEVLGSAEKAAHDLAVSSGETIETASAAVLEATKVQLEFLAAHPEVQAVTIGDDGLVKEIREIHHVGRNVCEVVKTYTPNEEKQVTMKAEARMIKVEEAMAAEAAAEKAKSLRCAVCGAKIKPGYGYRLWDAENHKVVDTCKSASCSRKFTLKE